MKSILRIGGQLTAAALLAGLAAGCGKEAPEKAPEAVRPVRAITVDASAEGLRRSFSGTVRPGREAALAFQVAGKVEEIAAAVGDRVESGQLLARLDPDDYRLMVSSLKSNLASAEASAKNSQAAYQRNTRLYENNTISKAELDLYETQRDSDRAQAQALRSQLEQANNQLDHTRLRAPFAGFIASRNIEEYETVSAGQPVFSLVDPRRLKVELGMPERLISRLRPGDPVEVVVDIFPGEEIAGTVSEVGVALDGSTGSYPVKVEITDPPEGLRPGMAAEAVFTFPFAAGSGYIVPTSALLRDMVGGENFIWIVEGGRAVRRRVKIGELVSGGVEIVAGLSPGEIVVTAGVHQLEEGRQVRLLE
ncbi:MAG: efflux RND transporter periplasmic adaptor subunit [Candidatus Erginobacter occultus]|nr:efflux RND transporter periplasmic adaptor subunit [Candidatus Erginobacter occultus]